MKEKKQNPIRFEAIIPFLIVTGLLYLYTTLFFDAHLKSALQLAGYHTVGAEVNIENLSTSFFSASIHIQNIELTNPEKPSHNSLQIGDVQFGVLWDALLRGKIVINVIAVEGVAIDVKRRSPGRVKPPSPPSPKDDALAKALLENKNKALGIVADKNDTNALGGLARILKGEANQDEVINQVKSQLVTETRVTEVDLFLKQKQADWQNRISQLPSAQDFKKIELDVAKIQTENFKTPAEVQTSVNQFQAALKELENHIKSIEQANLALNADTKSINQEIKSIDKAIQSDLDQLKSFLSVPKLDLKDVMHSLIMSNIQPYLAKVGYYRDLAANYMPPNLGKKEAPDKIELAMQPRPRANGTTYEFGKVGGYPLFWIQRVTLSSKANESRGVGDLKGEIFDITSNQALIQKATRITFKGDFPSLKWNSLSFDGQFDNRKKESQIDYRLGLLQYPVGAQNLLSSNDIKVTMQPATARFESEGSLKAFKDLKLQFKKSISNVGFEIESSNPMAKQSLERVFSEIADFGFNASIEGGLPHLTYRFDSDFGRKLEQGLGKEVSRLLAQYKAQAEKEIRAKLESEQQKITQQAKALENQIKKQVNDIKTMADSEKRKVESQKVALENQVKKQVDQKTQEEKKKIEAEVNKAKDQLKKKFGL